MKITCLFGLLCLAPAPAAARRLMESSKKMNEKDEYYEDLYGDGIEPNESDLSSSPSSAPSDGLESNFTDISEEHIGSKDYGYVEAKMLWKNGLYDCYSITETFWVDVQATVFPMCDTKWEADSIWATYAQVCKSGAEQFTMEEMDKCYDVEECSQVGVSAAAAVAGTFCKQNGLFHERAAWIPTKCVQHAQVSCKYDAVETVQKFNQGGVCADGSALEYVDEIHQMCEQEVAAMADAATLTGY